MSANASANSSNTSAKNAGNVAVANANAKNSSAKNAGNVVNTSANAKNASNVAAANGNVAVKNANKPSGGVLGALGSIFGAKPAANAANVAANNKPANAAANKPSVEASLNTAKARARTLRRQRGGARGKTMRLPGPRNVLRVTGKTVGKIRNVGVYGLKKVGNGVHMVTGLLGAGTKLVGSVLRKGGKTLKGLTKRRQQTRKQ